jgi:hypothetical protein
VAFEKARNIPAYLDELTGDPPMITANEAIEDAKELTSRVPSEVRTDLVISILAHRVELLSARLEQAEREIRTFLAAQ